MTPVRSASPRAPRPSGAHATNLAAVASQVSGFAWGTTANPRTTISPPIPPPDVHVQEARAMAPALAPASTAPAACASAIAAQAAVPGMIVGMRSGSPPGRWITSAAASSAASP
jgi:hypothetical protein